MNHPSDISGMENQTQYLSTVLSRYEQCTRLIELHERVLDILKAEKQSSEQELERATEPKSVVLTASVSPFRKEQESAEGKPLGLGYEYRGKFVWCGSQIDAYVGALRTILEPISAGVRQRVVEMMNRITPKHPELAESPQALFPNQRGSIKAGQWKQVMDGLVCYAVLDSNAKKKRLKRACRAAGLKYGVDVKLIGF